ncbi:hypothetical protein L7F22_055864 [Adiantum nelumboides]|nr:hypothetical protein [Adiantum nelumboides]
MLCSTKPKAITTKDGAKEIVLVMLPSQSTKATFAMQLDSTKLAMRLSPDLKVMHDVIVLFYRPEYLRFENGQFDLDAYGDPAYVRAACEASLKRLDVDYIDLYYQHRVDTKVLIEVTVGEMKKLVEEGYLRLLHRPYGKLMQYTPLQQSSWNGLCGLCDVEKDFIPTCRELGIGIVAYSPLGRGFFSVGAKILEGTTETDLRKIVVPRMQGGNLEKNQTLFQALQEIASRKGCTSGQLSLAWVQHQGGDVVPIPGTTRIKSFEENVGALQVKLSKAELEEIEALFDNDAIAGERYDATNLSLSYQNANTPPLSAWKAY